MGSFLFGSSGQKPSAFRGSGWQTQGDLLNQLFTSNLYGANPQLSSGLDAQIASLESQLSGMGQSARGGLSAADSAAMSRGAYSGTPTGYGSQSYNDLNNQLASLYQMKSLADTASDQFSQFQAPELQFSSGYSPYQFSDINFNADTAVGDSFTPLSQNLQNIFSERQAEALQGFDEELNRRGLFQSGAGLEGSRRIQEDVGDQLSNALAQLAGQQASQMLSAKQFQAQMEFNRELQQAAEIFKNQGANDQQALQLAEYAMRQRAYNNQLFRQPQEDLFRLYQLSTGATPGYNAQPGLFQGVAGGLAEGLGGYLGGKIF